MKLSETYGFNLITSTSSVTIRDGNNIIEINSTDWIVSINYPNGSSKQIEKDNWNASDLVNFLIRFYQENDMVVAFHNTKNNMFYEVDEYQVYFEDRNSFNLELQSVLYQVLELEEGKWYVAIKDKLYDDFCIIFDKWFNTEHEAIQAARSIDFFNLRKSYNGK